MTVTKIGSRHFFGIFPDLSIITLRSHAHWSSIHSYYSCPSLAWTHDLACTCLTELGLLFDIQRLILSEISHCWTLWSNQGSLWRVLVITILDIAFSKSVLDQQRSKQTYICAVPYRIFRYCGPDRLAAVLICKSYEWTVRLQHFHFFAFQVLSCQRLCESRHCQLPTHAKVQVGFPCTLLFCSCVLVRFLWTRNWSQNFCWIMNIGRIPGWYEI